MINTTSSVSNNKYSCSNPECNVKVDKIKKLHKINGGFYCYKHKNEIIKLRREKIEKEILGLTKEQKKRELLDEKNFKKREKRRKAKELRLKNKPNIIKQPKPPKIKGSKVKVKPIRLSISSQEKTFLWKELRKRFGDVEATKRLKNLTEQMKIIKEKLRTTMKPNEDLNLKFKQEFNKLVEGLN